MTICYLLGNIGNNSYITQLETVNVVISNKRLASVLSSEKSIQKKFGQEMKKKIVLRLNSLIAAHSLGDFFPPYSGPERCHELKGSFEGYFSFDLKHPYRLLFTSLKSYSKEEFPKEDDRWKQIKDIEIHKIINTHD